MGSRVELFEAIRSDRDREAVMHAWRALTGCIGGLSARRWTRQRASQTFHGGRSG